MGGLRAVFLVLAVAAAALTLATAAGAYTVAPGYSASDYATGFPFDSTNHWGPIGLAFDGSDNLYVSDFVNGNLYRFQPGGGVADNSTLLNYPPFTGGIKGLAFTRSGHLYVARALAGDVVEIDPGTARTVRTVVGGLSCPTGLATDPVSGDLFVSEACTNKIVRISNFSSGPGKASTYATPPCCSDGLAFAPDGTLYAASNGHVMQIDGTGTSTPGVTRAVAVVPNADGIAVGLPPAGQPPFLLVNGTDGTVTRVEFSKSPPEQSTVLRGGSRGDFVAVNSRGCLFVSQTSSIVRIAPSGTQCDLAPTTPAAGTGPASHPGITIDNLATGRFKCVVARTLAVRVRQRGHVRLRTIRVYVNGRYRRTVRHRKVTGVIFIRHVPRGTFTVKLVARTTKGRKLVAKKRFKNCAKTTRRH
jgi:sugar lactone lactonase YvrE